MVQVDAWMLSEVATKRMAGRRTEPTPGGVHGAIQQVTYGADAVETWHVFDEVSGRIRSTTHALAQHEREERCLWCAEEYGVAPAEIQFWFEIE